MESALLIHRLHFAFTATFHYLFPQLTMGLALLIVVLKTIALRRNDPVYHQAARFWGRIFGINFVLGVVTGIPMEFQFGTNWSLFSKFAGGVIGQTLPAHTGSPPSRCSSVRGFRVISSLQRMPSCSIQSDSSQRRTAACNWAASGAFF
jgi:hypothetical protein